MRPNKLPLKDYEAFRKSIKETAEKNESKGFVYKLYSENNGNRVPVHRVADIDEEGILYIGQTTNLEGRLLLLFRSFRGKPATGKLWQHGADEIYWQCQAMQEKFPIENLVVEIIPCDDSKRSEMEEISAYYTKFGEVPPFNGAIVKRRKG